MKKEILIKIIIGTIGCLMLAIGMCMCLISEWKLLHTGILMTIVELLLLISISPILQTRKHKNKKDINWKVFLVYYVGVIGTLVFGFGMSKVVSPNDLLKGILISVTGLIICILNYPIFSYLTNKKKGK